MALLAKLKQLFIKPIPVQDLSFGLIDTLGVRPMLQQQRWEQLETMAAALAPDDLTRLLDGLCLTAEYSDLLTRYQQSGNSELRQLAVGVHATYKAWQARSSMYAQELTDSQTQGFATFLNNAHGHLNRPFEHLLFRAEAAARLVRVAMGLSEPALAKEAFDYCLATNPTHLQGHLFYFNVLTPKWFGSEDELEDFVDNAPTPALRTLLQSMYLMELYQEVADSSAIVKQKYRNDNARYLQELLSARTMAPDSLYHIYLTNYLAGLHHALGQTAQRNELLRALGPATTYYPWMYFGLDWQAVPKLVGE